MGRENSFRSRVKKLVRKAEAVHIECNAQAAVIAVSPKGFRDETYASPQGMNEILGFFRYEPIPNVTPTVSFAQSMHHVTADVTQVSSADLSYLHDRLTIASTVAAGEREWRQPHD